MDKLYPIEVIETYKYEIQIKAKNKQEAIDKVKSCYENDEIDGVFLADANSHCKTSFKISQPPHK